MVNRPGLDNPKTLTEAVAFIRERSRQPGSQPIASIGLILGSGMGELADHIEAPTKIPYREIPGFPLSRVAGHAGYFILGEISGVAVIALAGRAHLYEGWDIAQATFPVRCLHSLGVTHLFLSNASGGINPRFHSGQIVLIDSHIDRLGQSLPRATSHQATNMEMGILRRSAAPYCESWMKKAETAATQLGFALARGTYLATLGPNYETRAEYRMFRKLGADMVGMSTVPEVVQASQLGMECLAFSIVTNVATPDAPQATDHAEVLDWSNQAQSQLIPLIKKLVPLGV